MEQNAPNIIDVHLKDASPMATVEKIRSIVASCGLTTKERWFESGTPYCYSNQISIPGTTFYTNGKGLTRELALASGYGELIERLQVGFIYGPTPLKDEDFALRDDRFEMIPVEQLLQEHPDWYQRVADILTGSTGEILTPAELLGRFTTRDSMMSVAPFLELHTNKKVYFPRLLWKLAYSSNGCAAGNSPEEALVQAISEIVERNHMIRIVRHGLALPEIPEEELKKYPVSYEIIDFIRSNDYKVFIKDASLGTGFPVVCACFIDHRTGRYHTHFGAHPVLEIALERALTESFQGRHLDQLTANEDFVSRKIQFSFNDFFTELRQSSGNKLPSFFVDESPYAFDPDMGMDCFDNKKLLSWCKDYFRKLGYPLLITDFSCLGFPTYQILSPGYSEAYINRISRKTDDQLYAPYASAALKDLGKADEQVLLGFLMHMNKLKTVDPSFRTLLDFSLLAKIPGWIDTRKQRKLVAASTGYAYIRLGKYGHAAASVAKMIPYASGEELDRLICLKRFLTMHDEGYDQAYVEKTLRLFHGDQTTDALLSDFREGRNPLEPHILHCDKIHCEGCILKQECCLHRVETLAKRLDDHMAELDFDAMAAHLATIA